MLTESNLRSQLKKFAKSSNLVGGLLACLDIALLVAAIVGACLASSLLVQILLSIVAGTVISSMFVLAHDASHGSLLKNDTANSIMSRILMLPTLHNATLWRIQHNRMHHQDTNVKNENSWSPLTLEEFNALPKWRQTVERIYRSGGFGIYYFIERWFKHKLFPTADVKGKWRTRAWADFALIATFLATWIAVTAYLGSVLFGMVIPFLVWNFLIGMTVYLHHTNPYVKWYETREEANLHVSPERAIHLKFPKWYGVISHNIMEHPAHHVYPTIPCYKLHKAQEHLNSLNTNVVIETMTLEYFWNVLTTCKLYDYKQQKWLGFPDK